VEQSLEKLQFCPSCGSEQLVKTISAIDYTYSKNKFNIDRCSSCSLCFTNPRPTAGAIGKYYDNPEYVSHTDTKSGLLFTLYRVVKSYTLSRKINFLNSLSKQKNALDFGAGTGDFSIELQKNGWYVYAYEPDLSARERIKNKSSNVELIESISVIDSNSISIITLWHVLEHVHTLNETLAEFSRIANDKGTLIIAVPNYQSYDAKHYGTTWAAYDVPRHLYHFDLKSIEPLLQKHGFILKQIKPMWFDSFYVSLLSEKNSRQKGFLQNVIGWGSALIIGLVSNLWAISEKQKASSVTYVFQKVV